MSVNSDEIRVKPVELYLALQYNEIFNQLSEVIEKQVIPEIKKSLKKIANEDCKEHWSCSECPQYLDQEIEINNFKYTCISLMVLDLVDP